MKTKFCLFIFLTCAMFCQGQSSTKIGPNSFKFEVLPTSTNTRYTEIGSGFFRNKFIMVSSKKIGGLAKIDLNTNEAYKELFCLDIDDNGALSRPLLFSRLLNTSSSEDQLSFSPDEHTVYYTRSNKQNSLEYKLYKASLEENSQGNWINQNLTSINKPDVSIENPFVNHAGDKLYFSANFPDTHGGFDLYVSKINPDGTLGQPENLGKTINTELDDKYPSLSIDDKYLFFSSKGHDNIGGFDVFRSKISSENDYQAPVNLGSSLNTVYDEIAYFLAARHKGYLTSNRPNGKGRYDIYTATSEDVYQSIVGRVVDLKTQIKLPNTLLVLKDEDDKEIARTMTKEDGSYSLSVLPFESYTLNTHKDGFKDASIPFFTNRGNETTYRKNIELLTTEPVIEKVDNELRIVLENIYFDFNKWNIKEESFISLNKIVKVLDENPDMKLAINAHTDNKGRASYNMGLSEKRAASTVKYLIKKGIPKSRLQFKGFGETKPLIDCKNNCSAKDLQANRRVEFVIQE
ncbi:OmpA family protein [Tamlana sp. 2201CG12-4]|uniref:OmpA family protein n=1 Tax=Tamlana sp. 2201CG12-4 TaxID=3112582 RepID=UPI002DB62CCF|nr:OmpA family protein [Tamlana sp. 2201CG12-4]MEC3905759.1 OmpA family protein [Tamlana sp. 2201CG12-4]